jgi:hypothetical protein
MTAIDFDEDIKPFYRLKWPTAWWGVITTVACAWAFLAPPIFNLSASWHLLATGHQWVGLIPAGTGIYDHVSAIAFSGLYGILLAAIVLKPSLAHGRLTPWAGISAGLLLVANGLWVLYPPFSWKIVLACVGLLLFFVGNVSKDTIWLDRFAGPLTGGWEWFCLIWAALLLAIAVPAAAGRAQADLTTMVEAELGQGKPILLHMKDKASSLHEQTCELLYRGPDFYIIHSEKAVQAKQSQVEAAAIFVPQGEVEFVALLNQEPQPTVKTSQPVGQ